MNYLTRPSVTAGALIIAIASVVSRLLGVLRDRALAANFGAGSVLDAYYAAFKIPDFIFNTLVLGALAAAFIPVFIKTREHKGESAAWQLAQSMFNILLVGLAGLASLGIIFAPQLMPLITPGFDGERLNLAITLTRIMMGAIILFGASNLIGSVLQAEQKFASYSFAPVMYNAGIIIGIYAFVPQLGPAGLAWGVVLGSLLHLLIQLPAVYRTGFRLRFRWGFTDESVREVGKLLGPRTVGLAASSLEQIITAGFVSSLTVGTLAAFTLAVNLQSFPINVFGVSLAVAAFPIFSQAASLSNHEDFIRHFKDSVRRILFFVIPLSILFLVLRAQIVRVVLGSGAFNWDDTIRTAQVLGYLSLAMVADSLVPLLARAFYALSDTITPAVVAISTVALNVVLLIMLYTWGLSGIGLAYVISRVLSLSALFFILGWKLKSLGASYILSGAKIMLGAALLAGASTYAMLHLLAPYLDLHTFVGIATQGILSGLVGVIVYTGLTMWWGAVEVEFIKRWLRSAWGIMARLWT